MKILSLGGGLLFCPHAIYRRSCRACDDAGPYDDARAGAAMMIDGKFTAKERSYLASLPAVKSVSASHIRYTDQFRVECMCRYRAGESPAAIFREAGLDPKPIGYKRVERCIAEDGNGGKIRRRSPVSGRVRMCSMPMICGYWNTAILRNRNGGRRMPAIPRRGCRSWRELSWPSMSVIC